MSSIKLSPNASGTGIFSIEAPNSNTNRTLTLPDNAGTIITTGSTAGVSQAMLASGVAGNGPAFSAKATSAQTISAGVFTKVVFGSEEFDTNNCFASDTFTPNVAGYYQITFNVKFTATTSTSRGIVSIYKNGATTGRQWDSNLTNNAAYWVSGSKLIYCNGTTDAITLYIYMDGTGTLQTSSNDDNTDYFSGVLVRAA